MQVITIQLFVFLLHSFIFFRRVSQALPDLIFSISIFSESFLVYSPLLSQREKDLWSCLQLVLLFHCFKGTNTSFSFPLSSVQLTKWAWGLSYWSLNGWRKANCQLVNWPVLALSDVSALITIWGQEAPPTFSPLS